MTLTAVVLGPFMYQLEIAGSIDVYFDENDTIHTFRRTAASLKNSRQTDEVSS